MATNSDKWFVGNRPVSEAFVGETKVYPAGGGVVYSQEFINCGGTVTQGKLYYEESYFSLYYTDQIDRILLKTHMNAKVYNLTTNANHRYYDLKPYGSDSGIYYKYTFVSGFGWDIQHNDTDLLRLDIYDVGVEPPHD